MTAPVLEISHLDVEYRTARGPFRAVKDLSFSLMPGERFGLVGESGSGKSTAILALMRMLRGGTITGGDIRLNGRDLKALTERQYRELRFSEMALVPQGAMSSLNPVLVIGEQMGDIYDDHGIRHSGRERRRVLGDLLKRVGLGPEVQDLYPHQLSGGMKQRVCIAMSIALRPSLILADEPTSALDVMVQKQVLATLGSVQRDLGCAILLIGHDMALMAHFVNRIGVMYRGELVETGPVREVFANPQHSYTRMLINSLPSFDSVRTFRTSLEAEGAAS
ncbi:peptide/nickel transport system ATP-binding protein [Devosia enhydra]|uniref:Peptide/nickel transport system ATP-binding protein n=1 Tax=Devosia enhydra TaxID=665118 RepID=A0A1K2HT16_9HYPH|nr:ABC transporter ATP-binding protein [Devosia enhydra]SFZ81245.1 peptide/nickel transport system ATP-binding protein [Devosia enhydra]